jgi:hypothetical protein
MYYCRSRRTPQHMTRSRILAYLLKNQPSSDNLLAGAHELVCSTFVLQQQSCLLTSGWRDKPPPSKCHFSVHDDIILQSLRISCMAFFFRVEALWGGPLNQISTITDRSWTSERRFRVISGRSTQRNPISEDRHLVKDG